LKSKSKWLDAASRHGFAKPEALKFYQNIDHDPQLQRHDEEFLPIFARKQKCYQFDTLIQKEEHPWIIFININSRKGYAYPMKNKSAEEVLKALQAHRKKVGRIN
jgi:hypothetical protein